MQAPAFGKGKVFAIEAVLGQRLMALGTALACLDGTQLVCVCVAGLGQRPMALGTSLAQHEAAQLVTAALSFYRLLGWNKGVLSWGHG